MSAPSPQGGAAPAGALTSAQAQRLFELSQDLLCVASLDGYYKQVNPAFTRLLGHTAEELYARPIVDFVHPEDRDLTSREIDLLKEGAPTFHFENRYPTKDGRVVRLAWRATIAQDEGLVYASARDVTDQHEAKEQLQLAHEELQAQAEELQAQSEELQAQAEELQAQAEELQAQTEELQAQTEELQAQTEALGLQGQKLEELNQALRDRNEAVEAEVLARTAELLSANGDLHALNEQLGSARELKARILDTVPNGIAFMDRDLVFRWANRAYQTPDFQGGPVAGRSVDVVHPRIAPGLKPNFQRVLDTGEAFRRDGVTFNPPDSPHHRYWDFSVLPARDEEGAVDGLLVIVSEATDRVERERLQANQLKQLQEIDALKDEFLAVVSHECRTPIHAIMGFASALEDEVLGPLTPEQRRSIHRILQGADRLLALIDDLLDMSRIQAGKFLLAPTEVAPAQLCEGVLAELAPLAEAKGHHLALQLGPHLPLVHADGPRLVQALSNLVGNAIKFTESAGTITLSATVAGDALCFEVQDPGPGISEADQARLFQRFTQLDMSATRASGGTGLGLSIVKAIAEAHGGTVGVRSDRGEGATFFLRIPLHPLATA